MVCINIVSSLEFIYGMLNMSINMYPVTDNLQKCL